MQSSIWNKKIPGLFGIFLTTISVAITVYLVRQGVIFLTRASPTEIPKNIRVTNISDKSFTLTYSTDDSVIGSLNVGVSDDTEQIILDDRDQLSQSLNPYKTHSITVKSLEPSTNYKYSITSGSEKVLNENKLFEISTANEIDSLPSAQKPITGKVITIEGDPSVGSLVYLSIQDSQEISTLTKEDGSYLLPLNSLRSKDYTNYYTFSEEDELKLVVTDGLSTSKVSLSMRQINPVPTIILSSNYDFRIDQNPLAPQPSESTSDTSFPDAKPLESGAEPIIENPNPEQTFSDDQPEFKGSAKPNETIEIEIHSDENIKTEVITDGDGKWSFRPQTPLSPGEHTITIKAKGSNGIVKSITRRFTVFAAGTQVIEPATPSGQTATPTPIPTLIPTATPTPPAGEVELSPSPIPTIAPTGPEATVFAGLAGAVLAIFGLAVFAITRYKLPL
ncbi:MAG: hypothetical protein A2186_01405 [Candidatus Levybacteria bacterium RIFOXYA1_FULL_41_10]|nr:MAG: Large repetitive protein [Candidatus Levybacteria bacterium GW2011_GWA1_39_34]KKR73617.1 MAG: Large repetitive protein [Candidatus Levybacteria bacterium GW2011_GWC2_40_7]KKR95470.1 MAG: Large repetitive protein [Candidatus Levybacteria bacterium GW2011_GWA2_41_15]OGH24639.1 MAG: hypothetical protein A3D82_01175 [Candidatus Levybacteria bacterium RIFCSPHIGHO2_02_FULL_40_29]OGH41584.1 MAG: hypothetical protein A2965_03150 [Candidatus Levybacteria bacterium RIFCSPLOWO2_01_FULL_40_96]OGH5